MAKRIQLSTGASEPYQHLLGLHRMVERLRQTRAWAITVINAFNRLGVTSRKPLPAGR